MPSPIGHALAGTAVAWAGDASSRRKSSTRFVVICALLAALPDVDLLFPPLHRSVTHSIAAVIVVFIIAAAVTGWVNGGRLKPARYSVAAFCALAWASHLLLDWLGKDTLPPFGVQILWPLDSRFFKSGLDLFAETERRHPFSGPTLIQNLWAAAQEIAIMAPVAAALYLIRVKALARLPAKLTGRDQPT